MLFVLLLLGAYLGAQSGPKTYAGYVYSQEAKEPVVGAQLSLLPYGQATATDIDGYFQLVLPDDTRTVAVRVQAFGFTNDTFRLEQATNNRLFLQPYTIETVEVRSPGVVATRTPGTLQPVLSELRNIPMLLGEPDILKSLTIYPGISGGIEGTAGLHVRGGSPDQNLMLLDDVTIYNSGHIFGFLSVFNSDVLNSVTLHRDYVPARYSSRISSIVDVSTRDGRADERSTKLSLGLINSNLSSEGPLGPQGSKITYTVGARLAHSAVPSLLISTATGGGTSLFAGMYDVNAKVTRRWDSGAKLSLGTYFGDDFIVTSDQSTSGGSSRFSLRYGNRNVYLRGVSPLGSRWFLKGTASLAGYQSRLLTSERLNGQTNLGATTQSLLNEAKIRQELSTALRKGTFAVGLALSSTTIRPLQIDFPEVEDTQRPVFSNFVTRRGEAFVDFSHEVVPRVVGFAGINVNTFGLRGEKASPAYFEPRAGLTYSPSEAFSVSASLTRLYQPLHYTTTVAPGFIYDVWIPASNSRPPSASTNYSLGTNWTSSGDDLSHQITLGGFYRQLSQLVTTRNAGLNPIGFTGEGQFFDELITGGTGRAYGFESKYDYQDGRNTWTVAYTYSRSLRSFPDLNLGSEFRYRFDRPHDLAVNYQRKLNERWNVSSTFVWQSGVLASVPTDYILDATGSLTPLFTEYNNLRLPHYHRLDLMFSKSIQTKRSRQARLDLGLYNVYARRNTSLITTRQGFERETFFGPVVAQRLFFLRGAVFQVIPTVNYTITW